MPERVYILWDFQTKGVLRDNLTYAKRGSSETLLIDFPDPEAGMSQGQIWLTIVKPQLDQATRVIGFMDLPNANVGFEIGYALGRGKKVALAVHLDSIPKWLDNPPFAGFSRRPMPELSDIRLQAADEDDWFQAPEPFAPGGDILFLCPRRAGQGYLQSVKDRFGWRTLPDHGWTLDTFASQLQGVGAVAWVVLPHTEGAERRDGSENAALSVIAGYAESKGITVFPLKHSNARDVADIMSDARPFSGPDEFDKLLVQLHGEIERKIKEATRGVTLNVSPGEPPPHPYVPPQFALDFEETVGKRFVGRRRFLSDFGDALTGLGERVKGGTSRGGALVQLIWCHGFGGMGKSWFLRQALLIARERLSDAQLALVDWDEAKWRSPLTRYPENQRELFSPIAERVAQLYGPASLDLYWRADARVQAAASDRAAILNAFQTDLDEAQREKPNRALRMALLDTQLWDGREPLLPILSSLTDEEETRERLFRAWCEAKGAAHSDREAVLRPEDLRTSALQESLRLIAQQHPLLLLLDTCECLSARLDRCLRRLISPLCDGNSALLIVIGSRRPPDVGITAGRDSWRTDVGDVRLRITRFDEDVLFTAEEISQALARTHRAVPTTVDLAARVRAVTRGVPLAVRLLLDMHERGDPVLSEVARGEIGDATVVAGSRAEQMVIAEVTKRFLLHLSRDRQRDYEDIIALSLMREFDFDTLATFWQTRNVAGRIGELADRYSLVASGDLHTEVRGFLRKAWRLKNRPEAVGQVIERLGNAVAQLEGSDTPGEPGFFELEVKKLNMLAWQLEDGFLAKFAPTLALALAYGESVDALLALAAEVNPSKRNEALLRRLRDLAKEAESAFWTYWPWLEEDLLDWLALQQTGAKWASLRAIAALNLLRGLSFAEHDRPREALDLLKEAARGWDSAELPRHSNVGSALFSCGRLLLDSKRDQNGALEAFELAIKIDYLPKDARANVGHIHASRRDYRLAEAAYRSILEEDWSYSLAHNGLGLLFQQQKRYEEALGALSKAGELDPTEPLYPRNIGDMYRERHLFEEAQRWYHNALEIDAGYAVAHHGLGLLFQQQKRYEEALEAFAKAAELDPTEPLYPRDIGDMFLDLNQLEKAESWYMKTLELDGDHAAAYNNLAVLRERQDRLAEALLAFERAAEIDATEVVYPCNAGYVLRRLARYEDANRRYRSVIDLNPDDPQGYCGLAWALWEAGGDLGEAEMLARKAVALRPDDIDTAHALATVLSERSGGASMESIRRWFAVASTDEHWWTPARHRDVIPTLAAAVVAGRAREIVSELQGLGPPSCWRPYMEAVAELLGGEGNDSTAAMEPNSISAQLAFAVKARGMNSKQTEQKSQLRT